MSALDFALLFLDTFLEVISAFAYGLSYFLSLILYGIACLFCAFN